jgi:hypothetical protein
MLQIIPKKNQKHQARSELSRIMIEEAMQNFSPDASKRFKSCALMKHWTQNPLASSVK